MFQLRFTTVVEAPLTVAFDVARTLGRPWGAPLEEVVSVRPVRDVYAVGPRSRLAVADPFPAVHRDRCGHAGRRAGRLGDRRCPACWAASLDQVVLRRRIIRAMQAHLDAYAAAAARRALDVVQVVGAAIVRRRPGAGRAAVRRPVRRLLGVPGRQGGAGESDLSALVREIDEELGVVDRAAGVPRRGRCSTASVGGGPPGTSTLRVWWARLAGGAPVAREHAAAALGAAPTSSSGLEWIAADRPLLPAVRALLARP